MEYREVKKRLEAASDLLSNSSTSQEKIASLKTLLSGIHTSLDEKLSVCEEAFSRVYKLSEGELVELLADHLPESTEEEKKRKKALLLFIKFWKDLASEVSRVQQELNASNTNNTIPTQKSVWRKIFSKVKGPVGIITIIAVGAVITLHATSVKIIITNNGCGTIIPPAKLPIPLPGFSLPVGPILNGASADVVLPPITVAVDGTVAGAIELKALTYTLGFEIPPTVRDVRFDGASLLKKKTTLKLSERKQHELVFLCSK